MINSLLALTQHLFFYMLIFSVQLLLILALRKPLRLWLGARYAYWLWALPLVWLPFHLWGNKLGALWASLQVSFNQLFTSTDTTTGASVSQEGFVAISRDFLTDIIPPLTLDFGIAEANGFPVLLSMSVIWISGLVLLAGIQYTRLHQFRKYLKTHSVPAPHPEVISPGTACLALRAMDGPAVFGILKPTLLIPEDYFQRFDANQRFLMMAHEQVHLQRHDNLWNLLAEAIRILFWFNPLVHIAHSCYRLDQELSCDAKALEQCNGEQQNKFARTLLETSACVAPTPPFALTAWDNLNELKERSTMIKKHLKQKRRPIATLLVATAIIFGGAACTSLTSKTEAQEPQVLQLTRQIYTRIEEVQGFMEEDDLTSAQQALDGIHDLYEQGELNEFESYMLWQFQAQLHIEQDESLAAVNDFENVLLHASNEKQKIQAHRSLGAMYYQLQDYITGIDHYKEVIKAEPNDSRIALHIAYGYYTLEDYEQAAPYAKVAIETNTEEPERQAYALLLSCYLLLEDFEAATSINDQMIELFDEPGDEITAENLKNLL